MGRPNSTDMNWSAGAAAARKHLGSMAYGDHEPEFERLARTFGLSAQTLRRNIAALKFVEASFPELSESLLVAPVAAIEHIARWHRYDPRGAGRAAQQLVEGSHTVRSLAMAEKKARAHSGAPLRGRSLIESFRERVLIQVESEEPYLIVDPERGRPDRLAPMVDIRLKAPGERSWSRAILLFGPYASKRHYSINLGGELLKAIGLTHIFALVLVALDSPEVGRLAGEWLSGNGIHLPNLRLMVVK